MSIDATNMTPAQHQALVRSNIQTALDSGDLERANVLRHAFADLLAMEFEDKPEFESSPVNALAYCWPKDR